MAGLQGALETSAPVSRLHEQRSYDPADFPVPTGREEEWRFTPPMLGLSAQQWPHTVRDASWMNVGPGGCGTVRVWHCTVRLVYGVLHGLVLPVWRRDGI
jgi:hypothetical protein